MQATLIVLCVLVLVAIVLIILFRPKPNNNLFAMSYKMDELFKKLDTLTASLKEDFKINRDENSSIASQNRQELSTVLNQFRKEMTETLQSITTQNQSGIEQINKTLDEKINALIQKVESSNKYRKHNIYIRTVNLNSNWRNISSRLKQVIAV